MHGFGGMGFGMGWGWIIGFFVLVAMIWLVVKTINQKNTPNQTSSQTTLEKIEERYAKGEIDKEEFEEKKGHSTLKLSKQIIWKLKLLYNTIA